MAMRDVSQHSLTMLFCIAIVGGLTLMMGQHARSESLFYQFRYSSPLADTHEAEACPGRDYRGRRNCYGGIRSPHRWQAYGGIRWRTRWRRHALDLYRRSGWGVVRPVRIIRPATHDRKRFSSKSEGSGRLATSAKVGANSHHVIEYHDVRWSRFRKLFIGFVIFHGLRCCVRMRPDDLGAMCGPFGC